MTVSLDLTPELEAGLLAQAEAQGVSLDQFLRRALETIAHTSSVKPVRAEPLPAAEWERGLDEWLDSFPPEVGLPESAFHRENWYPDRW